jgi:hypothetical protein
VCECACLLFVIIEKILCSTCSSLSTWAVSCSFLRASLGERLRADADAAGALIRYCACRENQPTDAPCAAGATATFASTETTVLSRCLPSVSHLSCVCAFGARPVVPCEAQCQCPPTHEEQEPQHQGQKPRWLRRGRVLLLRARGLLSVVVL